MFPSKNLYFFLKFQNLSPAFNYFSKFGRYKYLVKSEAKNAPKKGPPAKIQNIPKRPQCPSLHDSKNSRLFHEKLFLKPQCNCRVQSALTSIGYHSGKSIERSNDSCLFQFVVCEV
jgi:hypothetical protein